MRNADTEFQYRPRIVDTDIDCGPRFCGPRFRNPLFPTLGILSPVGGGHVRNPMKYVLTMFLPHLAHRNRSDFCDLRLRCPTRTPEIARFPRQETAMMHCDLRVRWKVASDLRFRAAISEPKTPSCCGISGDLAPSTQKSLAIAIVRFWCAKLPHLPCEISKANWWPFRWLSPSISWLAAARQSMSISFSQ